MSFTCLCLNGGRCIEEGLQVCECVDGFIGDRCQDVHAKFVINSNFHDNLELVILIVVLFFLFALFLLFCVLAWRRMRLLRKRRAERNRRQSRATIEGFSCSRETSKRREAEGRSATIVTDFSDSISGSSLLQEMNNRISTIEQV